jgi:hypothetical protein
MLVEITHSQDFGATELQSYNHTRLTSHCNDSNVVIAIPSGIWRKIMLLELVGVAWLLDPAFIKVML